MPEILKLEALPLRPGEIALVTSGEELAIEGRSADEIEYYLDLIREAGSRTQAHSPLTAGSPSSASAGLATTSSIDAQS